MRISVALRVYGPTLDPDAVTKALGVQPTERHKVGDERKGRDGRVYDPFTSGLWSLDSELASAAPLSEQVLDILNRVDSTKLKALTTTGVLADFFVGVFLAEEPSSVLVTAETANKLSTLGIPMDIAIYP